MNEPLLVSSLIIAGSEKTVEFFGAINFKFVSNAQRMFPSLDFYSFKLKGCLKATKFGYLLLRRR